MTQENEIKLKRTILYYPAINIPSGKWLRKALLYWDEVGSIVPKSYERKPSLYSEDIDFLRREGVYRPFVPDNFDGALSNVGDEFGNQLVEIVLSPEFQSYQKKQKAIFPLSLIKHNQKKAPFLIHKEKGTSETFYLLKEAGLARVFSENNDWYEVEKDTAMVYMGVLAKYLADFDTQFTVPGTDLADYQRVCFLPKSAELAVPSLKFSFMNVLPVPRDNVSFDDILKFKQSRRDHLLQFRQELDKFQEDITKCGSQAEVNEAIVRFGEKLESELNDFEAVLKDSKISTIAGSFEALTKAQPLGWLAASVVMAGVANSIAQVPVEWVLGGTGIGGSISISHYLINRRNEKRKNLRVSPLSYLYAAKRNNIIGSLSNR